MGSPARIEPSSWNGIAAESARVPVARNAAGATVRLPPQYVPPASKSSPAPAAAVTGAAPVFTVPENWFEGAGKLDVPRKRRGFGTFFVIFTFAAGIALGTAFGSGRVTTASAKSQVVSLWSRAKAATIQRESPVAAGPEVSSGAGGTALPPRYPGVAAPAAAESPTDDPALVKKKPAKPVPAASALLDQGLGPDDPGNPLLDQGLGPTPATSADPNPLDRGLAP